MSLTDERKPARPCESASRATHIPGAVSELVLELVQGLVQLVLRHQIAAITAHLHHSLTDTPQLVRLSFVVHIQKNLQTPDAARFAKGALYLEMRSQ